MGIGGVIRVFVMEKPKKARMLPEIYALFWQRGPPSGLVLDLRTEDGDDPELETTLGRRTRAWHCHRAGLVPGGNLPSGRFGMVVGRRDRRRDHRRTDRLDARRQDRSPGRAPRHHGSGSLLRRSVHRPSSPRGMASPPVDASARMARLAGAPGALARALGSVSPSPVARPAGPATASAPASAGAPASSSAWPPGSPADPADESAGAPAWPCPQVVAAARPRPDRIGAVYSG